MAKRTNQADRDRFVRAASRGELSDVHAELAEGMPADAVNGAGLSALYAAAKWGKEEVVQALLGAGANPNLVLTMKGGDEPDRTPLNTAASNHYFGIADMLLAAGASPRMLASDNGAPAHQIMISWPALANEEGAEEIVKEKLGRMFDLGFPINQVNSRRQSVLSIAVEVEAPTTILDWLLDQGANPNAVAEHGKGLIQIAAVHGHVEAIRFFALKGVSVDAEDEGGLTALFETSLPAVAKELLDLGADVNHQNIHGRTPLGELIAQQVSDVGVNELASVLLEAGARVDIPDFSGKTPMMEIKRRKWHSFEALIHAREARSAFLATAGSTPGRAPRP